MNITDNLIRIKEGKENIIQSLKNKGVEISDNALINEIPTIIDNAEIGGGGDTPSVPTELIQKYEGASVFRINVPTDNYEFAINLCDNANSATYDVDWGDGSLEYGKTTDEQHHIYSKKGVYDVNIYNISNNITLGGYYYNSGSSSISVYYLFNNTNNDYWSGKYIYQIDNTTITNVLIGNNIKNIGDSAFNSCYSLQSIKLPSTLTQFGVYIFNNCYSLQSVELPSTLTEIGGNIFQNCYSLQSIKLPSTLTKIGGNTFNGCSSLQSVVIPESVTSIGNYAFYGCISLQSIVIPNSVTSIGSNVFDKCTSLQSVVIPDSVTSIGSNAFYQCSSLQSVVIPDSVTSIGSSVFNGCSSLQSVVIPNSVTSIITDAFYQCSSLQSVVIPDSVTSIGNRIFGSCSSLQSVVIPNSITSITNDTFNSCSSLQSIVIPEGVTSIGTYGFYNCTSLQSITCLNSTAPTIQTNSFPTSGFKYTKRYLYVPKDSQGYDSGNWKTYLIDKGWELRYIEDYEKTPTILKLKISNNFLHKWEYLGQAKLIDYELVDNKYIYHFDDKIIELIQYTFYNNILEEIELPEGLEIISSSAFSGCKSLQSIVIPEGVTIIGSSAFQNCSSLQSVELPSTITAIKSFAFNACSAVHTFICRAMVAPTSENATWNSLGSKVPSGTPKILYIPEGATGYDSSNTYWKEFFNKGFTIKYLSELPITE